MRLQASFQAQGSAPALPLRSVRHFPQNIQAALTLSPAATSPAATSTALPAGFCCRAARRPAVPPHTDRPVSPNGSRRARGVAMATEPSRNGRGGKGRLCACAPRALTSPQPCWGASPHLP